MAKAKTQYVCAECGGASVKWQGQCPHCSAWNTLAEARIESLEQELAALKEKLKAEAPSGGRTHKAAPRGSGKKKG